MKSSSTATACFAASIREKCDLSAETARIGRAVSYSEAATQLATSAASGLTSAWLRIFACQFTHFDSGKTQRAIYLIVVLVTGFNIGCIRNFGGEPPALCNQCAPTIGGSELPDGGPTASMKLRSVQKLDLV